jgi:ABC-type polar amino acid transport system ATPase subunit
VETGSSPVNSETGSSPVNSALVVDRVSKRFNRAATSALREITLEVGTGEVIVLIGPSGSGKSTLLRCIAGLEKPDSGGISFGFPGRVAAKGRKGYRQVGMVFQNFNLYPHMNSLRNVSTALVHVQGLSRGEARERAAESLAQVGMSAFSDRHPGELSGGQQQRVAIARALALRPELMLFDEPTSALDPETVGEVLSVIRDIASQGMTMLIATHEMAFAREVADRVVLMNQGDICEEADCASFFAGPATERGREFLRRFSGEQAATGHVSELPAPLEPGGQAAGEAHG